MSGDYGYANARLRAMKSQLFEEADYENLLAREHVEALIAFLSTTAYQEDVETALLLASGVPCVMEALRLNVARTFRRMRSFFEQGEPAFLVDILLSRWDLYNIRTIVRGQVSGVSATEVLAVLVPAGRLDRHILEQLAKQTGLHDTLDLMLSQRLPYANALAVAARGYRGREDLIRLELSLDRAHYGSILQDLTGRSVNVALVRAMVQREIDCLNLSIFSRMRQAASADLAPPAESADWLIAGGTLESRSGRLALTSTPEEVLSVLAGTPYRRLLEPSLQNGGNDIPRELERYLARQGMACWYSGDPLGIAIAVGYVWAKTSEIVNLRLVTHAVAGDLSRPAVREELILWPSLS